MLTFAIDLDICDKTKLGKLLPQLCICYVLRHISYVHIGILRIRSVNSCVVQAACVLLVLGPAASCSPAVTTTVSSPNHTWHAELPR